MTPSGQINVSVQDEDGASADNVALQESAAKLNCITAPHREGDGAGTFYSGQEKRDRCNVWKPGRSGRKSFVATPEQRNNVKILVGLGVPQAMICQLVVNPQTGKPLDEGTLKKAFSTRNRGGRRRAARPSACACRA